MHKAYIRIVPRVRRSILYTLFEIYATQNDTINNINIPYALAIPTKNHVLTQIHLIDDTNTYFHNNNKHTTFVDTIQFVKFYPILCLQESLNSSKQTLINITVRLHN